MQNSDIFSLCDEITDEIAALQPTVATEVGIAGHDGRWDDFSPAGFERLIDALRRVRARVAAVPDSDDSAEGLAKRSALEYLDTHLDRYDHLEHYLQLNTIASTYQYLRDMFDVMDMTTEAGWQDVLSRVETIDQAVAGYRDLLDEGRKRGLTVAKRQVAGVVEQARVQAGPSSFFLTLPGTFSGSGISIPGFGDRLDRGARRAASIFGDFADWLESVYLPAAGAKDGAGEERYVRCAASFLGAGIDPRETYSWGWSEVGRLREEMRRVAGEIQPGASIAAALDVLKTDPARAAQGHDEFVRLMKERQDIALERLAGNHFQVPEEIRRVDVKIAPPGGSLGAYYVGPSEDFSRAGSVWYSLGDEPAIPLYDEVSTAYHEGFPGHHLQVGVQVGLADRLSRLHRMLIWYSGYGEGWALYAEQLMYELGYLEKPDYVFGFLASQMLRACRVVIDIGLHLGVRIPEGQPFHPGEEWTFDAAVEMLTRYATIDEAYARSEVTRYLGWPGQAISYKVGERAILDLRAEERRRRGGDYDAGVFHASVLESGPVGLDHLRDLVSTG